MSLIFNGIILRVTPFNDRGVIILLFTEEFGLVSAVVPNSKKYPTHWLEPYVIVKGKFKERHGELYQSSEIEGVRWFLGLREKPSALRTLRSCGKQLVKRIEPEFQAPLLYQLFLKIVAELDTGKDAETMEGLFLVKLALHEGLLGKTEEPWVEKVAMARTFAAVPPIPTNLLLALNRLFC